MKRKVWPIFAWTSGVLVAMNLALMGIAIFADDRFGWFLVPGAVLTVASVALMGATAEDGDTYEKKPRGWRKERRRAEKEAYVRKLEKELFDE